MTDRNLQDIFENLERLAADPAHEALLNEDPPIELPPAIDESCRCDGQVLLLERNAEARLEYRVCPACNPRLSCKLCLGTGHLSRFDLLTRRDTITPFQCECMRTEHRVRALNAAGIPDRYLGASLSDSQNPELPAESKRKLGELVRTIEAYCEKLGAGGVVVDPEAKIFLVFLGPVGTGKTHFAVAALKELILEQGLEGRFIDFQSLLSQLRDAYAKRNSEEDLLRPLRETPVLVIDEFGKGRTENEWQLEKLDDIMNHRYNAARPTLITTNYLPPGWTYSPEKEGIRNPAAGESFFQQSLPERVGVRMYDRILEVGQFLDFTGLQSMRKLRAASFLQRMQKGR